MIQKINFYTHIYKTYTVTQCILSRISSTKKKKNQTFFYVNRECELRQCTHLSKLIQWHIDLYTLLYENYIS